MHLLRDISVLSGQPSTAGWRSRAGRRRADPDAGVGGRDAERHYVSSKVMCWVALDRAIKLAPILGETAEVDKWTVARDEVRAAVLARGWSERAQAFCGAFESDELDASVMILPLVGFLPATDHRMGATIEAIEQRLGGGGLVRRWADDPSGFLICTFWLVECLALAGAQDRARTVSTKRPLPNDPVCFREATPTRGLRQLPPASNTCFQRRLATRSRLSAPITEEKQWQNPLRGRSPWHRPNPA